MNNLITSAKKYARLLIVSVLGLGAVSVGGYKLTDHSQPSAQAAQQQVAGTTVSFDMTVGSGRTLGPKGTLINEGVYPNQTATVFVPSGAKGASAVSDPKSIAGRTIHVTGRSQTYNGKPEVVASEIVLK